MRVPRTDCAKVFCIGANKSGTTSLTAALDTLGFDAMPESIAYEHFPYLSNETDEDRKDGFRRLIELIKSSDYRCFEDIPFNVGTNYEILEDEFPDAKFILTVRERKAWFDSVLRWNKKLEFPLIYRLLYGCSIRRWNRARIIARYEQRNAAIVEHFRTRDPGRLLVIDICGQEGWERLCPSLGVPIPSEAFPKKNLNSPSA